MAILFISDLHLDRSRPATTDLFLKLIEECARTAAALYILGDFVDYWLGDDEPETDLHRAFCALKRLSDSGTTVHFMHGNRDFLIGQNFAKRYGCELLPDPSVISLYGTRTLLMHGDTLCTDDVAYQNLRRVVRAAKWQRAFLAKPIEERRAMAVRLRETSEKEVQGKSSEIMDVNPVAVDEALRKYGATQLIHGHTHRPGLHQWTLEGQTVTRLVLGDWYAAGNYLECSTEGCRLVNYA